MKKVKVSLRPIVSEINLPTVLKTTILPGDSIERLFIATQVGEIFYIGNGVIGTFLDIRPRIIKLGVSGGGYDERGLIGLAFHPEFYYNGLFYLHYSVAGTQGPGALPEFFNPNPCDPRTLNLKWLNRETQYDHIDTVEEWILQSNGQPQKRRTLLNLRRPFFNHNGVNSLNFSPETGKLILTTGDGGSGYDPFNLSQDDMEIAGKIIEIDVVKNTFIYNPPVVTRFNELPVPIQKTLTVIAKGVRNIPGISFQRFYNQYIKYVGNVGQDLVESIFSFIHYKSIPVTQLIQASLMKSELDQEGFINFGWRGWEGAFPTSIIRSCSASPTLDEKTIAYYNETVKTSVHRLQPLTNYFHKDPRPDKFGGTALTGVQSYMGNGIPDLTGSVVFTDFARDEESQPTVKGVLAYTRVRTDCKLNDFSVIETDYNFGSQSAFYVSLGTNMDQTRLYLGVYGSMNVTDFNQGTIFEIVP
ncbi:glucose / Sorbosone dehydrogenase family protein [Clostridium argentinense CDC 2741]|uniref:Glucose / Sorbosone dehydrogenase family protein n=1 Tax=Clostridium argentinense CDC 2741 TaxID=1418104 RepID=A0A0C1UKV5_9CLOT|nr:PQQ-dependent sugar dehydrogenase [Clostridium argentinense]ARC86142.1 glucose dehydrogenase [Clostridium argentinense]KIE47895.1 glucose / Sorbosone dehydrogenase family protein [Clostridium argentinense CDC 2741]NFF40346.1 glucose dehydrogenase [Clostridium argentinense]NFP50153.1 glucose dehydrogenase [Clostridium argentinense]NFP72668.1 glucose dehydrogenase [Clostridium argentinense]